MPTKLDKYIVGRTLGKGAFAKVKLAQHSETGDQVAIKIMLQDKGTSAEAEEAMKQIMNEVEKLASLQHNFILNVVETAKEGVMKNDDGKQKSVIYVVLELAPGGEMFDFLMETGKFGEKLARFYFRQMIEGVYHIH
jgi:serine/threonine protein kinase